jgi:hypothetical protein
MVSRPLRRQDKVGDMTNIPIVAHHLIRFVDEIKARKHAAGCYTNPSTTRTTPPSGNLAVTGDAAVRVRYRNLKLGGAECHQGRQSIEAPAIKVRGSAGK